MERALCLSSTANMPYLLLEDEKIYQKKIMGRFESNKEG